MKKLLLPAIVLTLPVHLPAQSRGVDSPASPDEIYLVNGDRISGTILKMVGDELEIRTSYAGTVKVAWSSVLSFRSENQLDLRTRTGEQLRAASKRAGERSIELQASGGPRRLLLAEIAAINPPAVKPATWTGDVFAGLAVTRGNSDTQSGNAGFNLVRRWDEDRVTLGGLYLAGRTKDRSTRKWTTTDRRLSGSAKYDRFFSDEFYGFAAVGGLKDGVKSLDLRFNAGAGLGWQIVEREDLKAALEVGASWFHEDYTGGSHIKDEYWAGRVSGNAMWQIIEDLKYTQTTTWYPGFEDTSDQIVTSNHFLHLALDSNLFLQGGVLFDWDNTPGSTAERLDVKYTLSLGWSF